VGLGDWRLWVLAWAIIVAWRLARLIRDGYEHVQEVIRADAHAGMRTARAKEWVAFLRKWTRIVRV
jgi:hypothetical protein